MQRTQTNRLTSLKVTGTLVALLGAVGFAGHLDQKALDDHLEGVNIRNAVPIMHTVREGETLEGYFEQAYHVSPTSDNLELYKKRFELENGTTRLVEGKKVYVPVLRQLYNDGFFVNAQGDTTRYALPQ